MYIIRRTQPMALPLGKLVINLPAIHLHHHFLMCQATCNNFYFLNMFDLYHVYHEYNLGFTFKKRARASLQDAEFGESLSFMFVFFYFSSDPGF